MMRKYGFITVTMATCALSSLDADGAGKLDVFGWGYVPPTYVNQARYDEAAEAGFTVLMQWVNSVDHAKELLDLAQSAGIKLQLQGNETSTPLTNLVAAVKGHPALHGFTIVDVGFGDGTWLGTMHGTFWKIPANLTAANANGMRPISTYLKVIGDFARWGENIVFGCDDQAQNEFLGVRKLKAGAPKRERSQSNLWFVKPDELGGFGPPSGEGWVWLDEDVKAGTLSDPFLHAGYDEMSFECLDRDGGAAKTEFVAEGDFVRVRALQDIKGARAHFSYGPKNVDDPAVRTAYPTIEITDDAGRVWKFPNVNGDKTVICREVATERDLLYVGGVFYEVPADNAGGFAVLRPIALADEPVKTIEAKLGLVFINGRPMALDSLWKNGSAAKAYWLWTNWKIQQEKIK